MYARFDDGSEGIPVGIVIRLCHVDAEPVDVQVEADAFPFVLQLVAVWVIACGPAVVLDDADNRTIGLGILETKLIIREEILRTL